MAKKQTIALAKIIKPSVNSHKPKRSGPAPVLMKAGHAARHCDKCGKRYWRRSFAEMWMMKNGTLVQFRVYECTNCFKPTQAARFMLNMQLAPPQFKVISKPIASR